MHQTEPLEKADRTCLVSPAADTRQQVGLAARRKVGQARAAPGLQGAPQTEAATHLCPWMHLGAGESTSGPNVMAALEKGELTGPRGCLAPAAGG